MPPPHHILGLVLLELLHINKCFVNGEWGSKAKSYNNYSPPPLGVCRTLSNTMQKIVQKHDFYRSNSVRSPVNRRILRLFTAKFHKSDRLLGVCRTLSIPMKKMRKNIVFEHFLLCKLRKEPQNRWFLQIFSVKTNKSDRLLVPNHK